MDFTRTKYRLLLKLLKKNGYQFITYSMYCEGNAPDRFVILRHDVVRNPLNALRIAKEEEAYRAKATFYFRAVPECWNEKKVIDMAWMGHEIGYLYESLVTCQGNTEKAYEDFCHHLEELQKVCDMKMICANDSLHSSYDNKDLWKEHDYKSLGFVGEPYLTTDFSKMLYLSDAGRRWDGYRHDSILGHQEQWKEKGWSFHSTNDIIQALWEDRLPDQLMITTHPHLWNDFGWNWLKEKF